MVAKEDVSLKIFFAREKDLMIILSLLPFFSCMLIGCLDETIYLK